jgi:hypothetical protein
VPPDDDLEFTQAGLGDGRKPFAAVQAATIDRAGQGAHRVHKYGRRVTRNGVDDVTPCIAKDVGACPRLRFRCGRKNPAYPAVLVAGDQHHRASSPVTGG